MIELSSISHVYNNTDKKFLVLNDISLKVIKGESCAIIGGSGSGKSTLLNIIGLLDRPTKGHVLFQGQSMMNIAERELAIIRNKKIGFIFQNFNLLNHINVVDNVALPLLYRGMNYHQARHVAYKYLDNVGLGQSSQKNIADLSGGQRQRVAIARALVGNPSLLLADEPTGNLDSQTAGNIVNLLLELNLRQNLTLIMVTHDNTIAGRMQRCVQVKNGILLNG